MSNELFKTIEAQGLLLTELRAELDDIKELSRVLVDYNYDDERKHFEESECEEVYPDSNDNHIFTTIKKLERLIS